MDSESVQNQDLDFKEFESFINLCASDASKSSASAVSLSFIEIAPIEKEEIIPFQQKSKLFSYICAFCCESNIACIGRRKTHKDVSGKYSCLKNKKNCSTPFRPGKKFGFVKCCLAPLCFDCMQFVERCPEYLECMFCRKEEPSFMWIRKTQFGPEIVGEQRKIFFYDWETYTEAVMLFNKRWKNHLPHLKDFLEWSAKIDPEPILWTRDRITADGWCKFLKEKEI